MPDSRKIFLSSSSQSLPKKCKIGTDTSKDKRHPNKLFYLLCLLSTLLIGSFSVPSRAEGDFEAPVVISISDDEPLIGPIENANQEEDLIACVVINNPRTGSLFFSNFLHSHGSRYFLHTRQTIKGCENLRKNLNTPSMPLVKLSFQNEIREVLEKLKPVENKFIFIQGDEFCRFFKQGLFHKDIHITQYYQDDSTLAHFPIGSRSEILSLSREIPLLNYNLRKYKFNFMGSLTNSDRRDLQNVINLNIWNFKVFTRFFEKWSLNSKDTGLIQPNEYFEVLKKSIFTLCPMGHNPETFRLFEAIEAESIPIIALTENYRNHACTNSLKPYLDVEKPFIVTIETWEDLPLVIEDLLENPEKVHTLQMNVRHFKNTYWKQKAKHFDCVLSRNCEPKFIPRPLITGCGRSGTFSVAKFLEEVGVAATHEDFKHNHVAVSWLYGVRDESYPFESLKLAKQRKEVERFQRNLFSKKLLLVRHPLKVISSVRRCFCGAGNRKRKFGKLSEIKSWKFVERHLEVDFRGLAYDSIERAALYWLEWNKKILSEHEDVRVMKLEDLTPRNLLHYLGMTGQNKTKLPERIGKNVFHVSKKKVYEDTKLSDIIILNKTLAKEIITFATQLGYSIES